MNQQLWIRLVRAGVVSLCSFAVACGDGEDATPGQPSDRACQQAPSGEIEIGGTWVSTFQATETIDSDSWNDATIAEFDNELNFAITRNADDAEFSPGLYNRIVWTEPADCAFYYCTVAFGLESVEAARESTATADDSDPETQGCGGTFPWTGLDPS
jgi:hypothetical protein